MRIDGWLGSRCEAPRPIQVAAPWMERIPRKIEVVLVEPARQITRAWPDLYEISTSPGPTQRDGRLPEEKIDVNRCIGLPRCAVAKLIDQPYDRSKALRKGNLVVEGSGRRPRSAERDSTNCHEKRPAASYDHRPILHHSWPGRERPTRLGSEA